MTGTTESQFERYSFQYEVMEGRYGRENMADSKLSLSDFETQMIRVKNTAKANISAAKEKMKKGDLSKEDTEELQSFLNKNRNILKNPIRYIVSRQTYSASAEQAKSIKKILLEAGEEAPTIAKIRTTINPTKTLLSETLKEAMRKRYAEERAAGTSPKTAARRVWHSFGGS